MYFSGPLCSHKKHQKIYNLCRRFTLESICYSFIKKIWGIQSFFKKFRRHAVYTILYPSPQPWIRLRSFVFIAFLILFRIVSMFKYWNSICLCYYLVINFMHIQSGPDLMNLSGQKILFIKLGIIRNIGSKMKNKKIPHLSYVEKP